MRLFTLGYSGLAVPLLREWLNRYDALLVDVRIRPFSRDPEWRQTALSRTLGTRYRHVPELGNLNYRGGPTQLANETEGVRIVSALLREKPVVLLCVCTDPARCHRAMAANAISKVTGAEVTHLSSHDFRPVRQLDLLIPNH